MNTLNALYAVMIEMNKLNDTIIHTYILKDKNHIWKFIPPDDMNEIK